MDVNVELLRSLVAGWISGAAAGLASTGIWLVAMSRRPALAAMASRLPRERFVIVFGIVFANASVISLTLVGLLLGAVHHRLGGGPGSPFSLLVLGGGVVIGGAYVFVRGGLRAPEAPWVLFTLAVIALAFGVMLPVLVQLES